jgi:hypothetical protein
MEDSVSLTDSGSGPLRQKIPTRHHPEGIDPDQMFFQESRVHELILSYQRNGDPQTWQAIVMECLPLIDSLIRKHHFQLYEDLDALRNECVIKLFKAIRYYDPERGRAFSCLTVAITRFLFSYVATVRTRARRFSLVPDEVLAEYESAGQSRTELPEELKNKIQRIQTRFKTGTERAVLKFLINYFLLEGFSQPRKLVLDTIRRQFGLPIEKAGALYDYGLVCLRSVLHQYYTPLFSGEEILRLCQHSSVLPQICAIVGEHSFSKLMDVCAGISITFPSKAALERLRKAQRFLIDLGNEQSAFTPGPLEPGSEQALLGAVLEGHHTEVPLYGPCEES